MSYLTGKEKNKREKEIKDSHFFSGHFGDTYSQRMLLALCHDCLFCVKEIILPAKDNTAFIPTSQRQHSFHVYHPKTQHSFHVYHPKTQHSFHIY